MQHRPLNLYKIMKKTILFIVTILGMLVSCSEEGNTYKIAVSQCGTGRWREKVNCEMLAAQFLYDQHAEVKIVNAYDDTQWQIRQIDSLANTDIDLLVVAPNESAPISDAIVRIQKKGIPVIYFDRKASTDDYAAFIGGDNVEAGRTMGNYASLLADTMLQKGKKPLVLEVTGAMSTSPAQERHKGFAEVLENESGLEYVMAEGDWTSDKAYEIVMHQINTGKQPDIVFCHNDGMATGVYKAVVETSQEGNIQILGIDGLPDEGLDYVTLGHQVGSYVYPTHGEEIVRLALNILSGRPYERDNVLNGMLVTPENVELITLTSQELMAQHTDLATIHDKLENYFGLYNSQHKILWASLLTILMLVVAVFMAIRAYVQIKRTIRQRQTMNEEQTLFYTDASRRIIYTTPEEDLPQPRSQDVIFAEKLKEAIHKNMSNPNLKMDDLGEELGLHRVQLYRKVKALTGLSPVELLRQMRLQQAYVLLGSTTKTVAEIAYEVGFNTPGYFSKCFREQYGKLPTDLREVKDNIEEPFKEVQ